MDLLSATAMLFPVLRASDCARHLLQGALSLGNASFVMTATSAQLIGDSHHHSCAVVAEDAGVVAMLVLARPTQVAESIVASWSIFVHFGSALLLLVHLHQLHDWLRSLDVAVSSIPSGFSWSLAVVRWQSEGLALLLFLLFLH